MMRSPGSAYSLGLSSLLLLAGIWSCSDRSEDCSVLLHCPPGGTAGNAGSGGHSGGSAGVGGTSGMGGTSARGGAGPTGGRAQTGGSEAAAGQNNHAAAGAGGSTSESGPSGGSAGEAGSGGSEGTGEAGSAGAGGSGGNGVVPCDEGKRPNEAACVVDEEHGVFVAPSGADTASGTREQPVRTLARGLELAKSTGKFVIACNATYDAVLAIRDGVKLYGGFACPGTNTPWEYVAGTRAQVALSAKGIPLSIVSVPAAVEIDDFEFVAKDGTAAGDSSVAASVVSSPQVVLRRVRLVAGRGIAGADAAPAAYTFPALMSLQGNPGTDAGGASKKCTCPDTSVTTGGAAGSPPDQDGASGTPDPSGPGGEGGSSTLACNKGGGGSDGVTGASAPDAPGASNFGVLSASGWAPAAGANAKAGSPGQGGGGGAGKPGGGGGGGGCGGCGGRGGDGGKGGGSSVALLAIDSPVSIEGGQLLTSAAGNGGRGASGQGGQATGGAGGDGYGQGNPGCDGGNGGPGGNGGAGGGAAGGVSVAVVYKGTAPTLASSVLTTNGIPGAGGIGGHENVNDGVDGVAQTLLLVP